MGQVRGESTGRRETVRDGQPPRDGRPRPRGAQAGSKASRGRRAAPGIRAHGPGRLAHEGGLLAHPHAAFKPSVLQGNVMRLATSSKVIFPSTSAGSPSALISGRSA